MCSITNLMSANTSFVADFIDLVQGKSNSATLSRDIVTEITARIAIPLFALIDATYHLMCALVKLPFVALKLTVADLLDFGGAIPDTLGSPDEWITDMKMVVAAAITLVSALTLGLVSTSTVISIGESLGLQNKWVQ